MISVIIPTYKSPHALDLCLQSATKGQMNKNEIIVVTDGHYELNKDVLTKYSDDIHVLDLETNVGTCKATNLGVYNSSNNKILIVNDDNVFPKNWDSKLESVFKPRCVISPNQIEPYPSMFKSFHIKDLGRTPDTFNMDRFWEYEASLSTSTMGYDGSTYPIFMDKSDYMRIGGYPEDYPSQSGFVADWEFFMKCQLSDISMLRSHYVHFYHFVSLTTSTPESIERNKKAEIESHEYAKYKWGSYIKHDPNTNLKYIQ